MECGDKLGSDDVGVCGYTLGCLPSSSPLFFLLQWLTGGCSPAGRMPTTSSAAMPPTPTPSGCPSPQLSPLLPPPHCLACAREVPVLAPSIVCVTRWRGSAMQLCSDSKSKSTDNDNSCVSPVFNGCKHPLQVRVVFWKCLVQFLLWSDRVLLLVCFYTELMHVKTCTYIKLCLELSQTKHKMAVKIMQLSMHEAGFNPALGTVL